MGTEQKNLDAGKRLGREIPEPELENVAGGRGWDEGSIPKACPQCGSTNIEVSRTETDSSLSYDLKCRDCGHGCGGVLY